MRPQFRFVPLAVVAVLGVVGLALADAYTPADRLTRTAPSSTEILPERFLRGFDPITVTFPSNTLGENEADIARAIALKPAWPGAWSRLDGRTAQFRPAEAWPPLRRFSVETKGKNAVLSTMMTAPTEMQPADGARNLPPFRTLTLTFPQPLPLESLRSMLSLEVRPLPGVGPTRRKLDDVQVSLLPRNDQKDAAVYALQLGEDVPEGSLLVVTVALALGDETSTLWTGRVATRTDFRLDEVVCAGHRLSIAGSPNTAGDQALDCGTSGEQPELLFSAPVGAISLSALKKLVRLEPAVADLKPVVFGHRVSLSGSFVPDTLYRLRIGAAPISDDLGRPLQDPGDASVHFFVGWKQPWLRTLQSNIVVEANGPRLLPMSGYADARADVRIHRVDPRFGGLWPFREGGIDIDEDTAPPFPGEEPAMPERVGDWVEESQLAEHIRLLGSPLVSRVVDLPLKGKATPMHFGLDVGALIDTAPGLKKNAPGSYLVGVRRLQGRAQRHWSLVQATNLSLTAFEERQQVVFYVRALDTAAPVGGATITIEAVEEDTGAVQKRTLTTDNAGRANALPEAKWNNLVRVTVSRGDDVLVIDPNAPPPRFFDGHWSGGGTWLSMLTEKPAAANKNDGLLGFLFSERPIYRPGEQVFLKGWARQKKDGVLSIPTSTMAIKVVGPDGAEYSLKTTTSALGGADAVFTEASPPTGQYTAYLSLGATSAPVASRTFKIEAYRLPTFEVQLNGASRVRLDQPFSVRASARYYAGGNVANQPVRWNVSRRPAWHTPKGREGFLFASSSQFARAESANKLEQTERTGTLNDDGSDAITMNPEKDLDGSPRIYRFEATVTGADDQEVSSVTEVLALPPFVLGMKLERFKKSATSITPELIAVGVDDKLVAGQALTVRLFKRTWHSHLRESHFATGEASYVTEQQDTKILEQNVTTTAAPLPVPLAVQGAGVYVVEVSGKDKLGRVQTLSADLYIGGKEPVSWQKSQAGVFELVPDKATYAPGQTANIVVKSPFRTASGLLVVERPSGNEYRPFNVVDGNAAVSVAIEASMTPNVPVHVVLSRGRLGESSSDDAAWRPQTTASSIDLEVSPREQQLSVVVKHPAQARPGDTVPMTVTLADDDKKPVGGEVTLWLVDEAVLSLAREGTLDPLSSMVVRNASDTSVSDTRNSVVGRVLEEETPGGDGGDDSDGTAKRRVRKNFQTVPYYKATLVVPASGRLDVNIPLSDDLTTFVVRAVAASGASRFGHVESKLKVRLPVIVQPQLPRFVRQGDRFEGGAVARLVEGAGGAGYVKAEYTGPVVERKRSKDITLALDAAISVTFPVEVAATASTTPLKVKMEVARKADGVGDAFEVTLPVLPDVPWQQSASLVELSTTTTPLPGPRTAPRADTATQTSVATNVVGLLEAVAALEYLEAYPHGCLEQKLAQLSPVVVMASLATQLGGERYGKTARGQVERLLQEFAAHQDDRGLFSLWPGGVGNVQVTGLALRFAADAQRAGFVVDNAVMQRARAALSATLRSDYGWSSDLSSWRQSLMASSLRALAVGGAADDAYLTELLRARKTIDGTARAELALAVLSTGKTTWNADLKALTDELWSSVTFNLVDGRRTVVGISDPRAVWGRRVLGSSTSTLATVLEALVRLDPKNADLPLVFEALLRTARSGSRGFGSTWDNAAAIRAITAYVTQAQTPAGGVVSLGAQRTTFDGTTKVARLVTQSGTPIAASTTKQPTFARQSWRSLPATTGDRLAAERAGLLVKRSMSIYPVDGGATRRVDDVRAAEQRFTVGDVVELHTQVTTDEPRYNVAIVVPFAAGFEPLNPTLSNASSEAVPAEQDSLQPTAVSRVDDEVRYYFDVLPKGTVSLHFRIKALTPGSFTHPGAHAELMYDEAVNGRSDGSRAIVVRNEAKADSAKKK